MFVEEDCYFPVEESIEINLLLKGVVHTNSKTTSSFQTLFSSVFSIIVSDRMKIEVLLRLCFAFTCGRRTYREAINDCFNLITDHRKPGVK